MISTSMQGQYASDYRHSPAMTLTASNILAGMHGDFKEDAPFQAQLYVPIGRMNFNAGERLLFSERSENSTSGPRCGFLTIPALGILKSTAEVANEPLEIEGRYSLRSDEEEGYIETESEARESGSSARETFLSRLEASATVMSLREIHRKKILARIHSFSELPEGWRNGSGHAPNAETIQESIDFYEMIWKRFSSPEVSVAADGEISFYWKGAGYFIDVSFYGDEDLYYYARIDGSIDESDVAPFMNRKIPSILFRALQLIDA